MLAYGSETRVLSNCDETVLGVFERNILRAIFGSTNDNGEWRIKYNNTTMSYIRCTRKVIQYHTLKLIDQNGQDVLFVWRNRAIQEEFWLQW